MINFQDMLLRLFVVNFMVLYSVGALAQMNKTKDWETGIYYGPIIAASETGISEVIQTYSFKIAKGMSYYRPELFYHAGRNKETRNKIEYELFGLTFKNSISIEGVGDFRPFLLTGIQLNKYNTTGLGEQSRSGFHVGAGFGFAIAEHMQLRGDFMICNGAARLAIIDVGLQFSFGGAPEGANDSP